MWHYAQFGYGEADLSLNWNSAEDYLSIFPGHIPANVYPQVPHCAVRLQAMGWAARPATDEELKAMEKTTREWLEAGAGCLCLGLDYQPSANGRRKAWEETIEMAQQAEIPVHISHERVDDEIADILDRVEREGIDLTFESYLYPAGMTHMVLMLPMEFQAGSPAEMLANLENPMVREKSLSYLREKLGRCDQIVGYTRSGRFIGMTLKEAAEQEGKSPEELAFDLVIEEEGIETFVFPWQTPPQENEVTLNRTAVHPRMMIASDGVYNIPHPHPRGYGCFVQFLRRFGR